MKQAYWLFVLVFFLFPSRALAQRVDCHTFSSSGNKVITVDNSFDDYYLIAFGANDYPANDSLSLFAARESPDGGSDVRISYSHRDLPVALPFGAVNGIEFALTGVGDSTDFWITLASTPSACPATTAPTAKPTSGVPQTPTSTLISATTSPTSRPTIGISQTPMSTPLPANTSPGQATWPDLAMTGATLMVVGLVVVGIARWLKGSDKKI